MWNMLLHVSSHLTNLCETYFDLKMSVNDVISASLNLLLGKIMNVNEPFQMQLVDKT